eukprot:CAMPEP_0181117550 /NCGR_PEP_ID=MMETSP1071-20121207/22587_1 /TAXON_ID=35127 /ORGANISM="Thalassiosira sp., Strain NH16" /LENGTH=89 /DNA_ID=CAMNT_0023201955 /DNA_START=321 /DNA_END=590 /DNA_ORIENTATION=-
MHVLHLRQSQDSPPIHMSPQGLCSEFEDAELEPHIPRAVERNASKGSTCAKLYDDKSDLDMKHHGLGGDGMTDVITTSLDNIDAVSLSE